MANRPASNLYLGTISGTSVDALDLALLEVGGPIRLRAAAEVLRGRSVADHVRMLVVPGSEAVQRQAEDEGLDRVFTEAGAEWRLPGCSMCVGRNGDTLKPGERSASTSNRNFRGRQGPGSRTHLVSPAMAAAAAVAGHFTDVRDMMEER